MNTINPKKILIIQLRRVGDVILTTPVVEAVHNQFPDARIDFLVEKPGSEMLKNNPYLSVIHVYEKTNPLQWIWHIRKMKYDWVLDFLGNPRTVYITALSGAKLRAGFDYPLRGKLYNHRVKILPGRRSVIDFKMNLLQSLHVSTAHAGPALFLTQEEHDDAVHYIQMQQTKNDKILIGIAPVHRRATRQWPAEYYAELCDRLIDKHNADLLLLWGPGEEEVIRDIQEKMSNMPIIPPLVSLRKLGALIARCRLVIANSNGPMHIAEALKVPTLTIYGPNDPVSWESGNVVQSYLRASELPCIGCEKNICKYDELRCMKNITPDMVEAQFKKLLMRIEQTTVKV